MCTVHQIVRSRNVPANSATEQPFVSDCLCEQAQPHRRRSYVPDMPKSRWLNWCSYVLPRLQIPIAIAIVLIANDGGFRGETYDLLLKLWAPSTSTMLQSELEKARQERMESADRVVWYQRQLELHKARSSAADASRNQCLRVQDDLRERLRESDELLHICRNPPAKHKPPRLPASPKPFFWSPFGLNFEVPDDYRKAHC